MEQTVKIIWFDVCAVGILVEILYTYIIRRSLRVRQNYIFLAQTVVILLTTLGSLVSSLGQNDVILGRVSTLTTPLALNTSTFIYMQMHILTPLLFVLYIYSLLGLKLDGMGEYLGLFLPVAIALMLLGFTPATGAVFYFDEFKLYNRGEYMWVFYLITVFYIVYGMYLIIAYRKNVGSDMVLGLTSFAFFSITGVLIQFMDSSMKVEDFANSMVIVMIYIMIERPADYIDSQTDFQNSKAFYLSMVTKYKRKNEVEFILLSIDNLDFLDKQIGIAKSDILLSEAGKYLETYEKSAVIYRLGRGCFALVKKNNPRQDLNLIMEGIRERFREAFTVDNYNIQLYDSCCVIRCPENAETFEDLRHLIMLSSTPRFHRSRHRYEVSDVDVEGDLRKRQIDRLLRKMITDMEGLIIKYQPVYNVRTGRFDGVQLKTLINSKEYGIISRREYLDVSQNNGTAVHIETHIFSSMCSLIAKNEVRMAGVRDFAMELPVGALMVKGGADIIISVTDSYSIPHHYITFELTEDVVMNYQGTVKYNVEKLRERGFSFALINYGGGYTDAGTLLKMPLSSVTFDKALTLKGAGDERADTILRSSVDMLKNFNIKIKAEAVENSTLKDYVLSLGCDLMQGYFLSMIFSEEDLLTFLKEQADAV